MDTHPYFHFLFHALWPQQATMADGIYNRLGTYILAFAKQYSAKSEYQLGNVTLYRGLLLTHADITGGKLNNDPRRRYSSFSTDPCVAEDFANPAAEISIEMMQMYPQAKGYIIEHVPDRADVLFDYRWFDEFNFYQYYPTHLIALFYNTLIAQKEIILVNRGTRYALLPRAQF